MKRILAVLVVAGLGWLAAMAPTPQAPAPSDLPEPLPTPLVGCIGEVERTETGTVWADPGAGGSGTLTGVATGSVLGTVPVPQPVQVSLDSLIPAGFVATAVDFSETGGGAAVLAQSEDGALAAATCHRPITVSGGITAVSTDGEQTTLVISNPYTVDADVAVSLSSEIGRDTAAQLESVIVPARSVVTRDLTAIVPLRQRMSIVLTPRRGAIHALVVERGGGDTMYMEAVSAANEWWVAVPQLPDVDRHVTIVPAGEEPVQLTVDLITPDGTTRDVADTGLEAGEQLDLTGDQLGDGPVMVHVFATGPVLASSSVAADGVRAGSPGVAQISNLWVLPGAGEPRGTVTLLVANPGDVAADLDIDTGSQTSTRSVEAGSLAAFAVPARGTLRIDSSSPVAVEWMVTVSGVSLAAGFPIDDYR